MTPADSHHLRVVSDETKRNSEQIERIFLGVGALHKAMTALKLNSKPVPVNQTTPEPAPIDWMQYLGRQVDVILPTDVSLKWRGPSILTKDMVILHQRQPRYQIRLFTGPTRPNWVEWHSFGAPSMPKGLDLDTLVLVQGDHGGYSVGAARKIDWRVIVRYTIIED